jgi:sulfur-carrier protein
VSQLIRLLYFAWLRERIGKGEESLALPEHVRTISELITHLTQLGEEYAYAFEDAHVIRAALDQKHAKPDALIAGAREIAFFPPMTGG